MEHLTTLFFYSTLLALLLLQVCDSRHSRARRTSANQCAAGLYPCYGPGCSGGRCCFDHFRQTCCGGTLAPLRPGRRCCEGTLSFYDSTTHQCCGGEIYVRDSSRPRSCCGGQRFDRMTHICCEGTLHNKYQNAASGSVLTACCAGTPYDSTTHMCCDGHVVSHGPDMSCCGSRSFNHSEAFCVDDEDQGPLVVASAMCGGHPYDTLTQVCCNGTLNPRPEDHSQQRCCGHGLYDSSRDLCCHNTAVVQNEARSLVCCEHAPGGHIDTRHHICCDGYSSPIVEGRETQCCGAIAFTREDNHGCCQGSHPATGHWQNLLYDTRTQQCCGGLRVEAGTPCCANRWTMGPSDVCCERHGPQPPNGEVVDACCEGRFPGNGFTLYNNEIYECRDGEVSAVRPGWVYCGIQGYYNPRFQLCCEGSILNKEEGRLRCCSASSYDPETHDCLNGVIEPKRPENGDIGTSQGTTLMCNGVEPYNSVTQLCCVDDVSGGQAVADTMQGDMCCGLQPYFTFEHDCLFGILVERSDDI